MSQADLLAEIERFIQTPELKARLKRRAKEVRVPVMQLERTEDGQPAWDGDTWQIPDWFRQPVYKWFLPYNGDDDPVRPNGFLADDRDYESEEAMTVENYLRAEYNALLPRFLADIDRIFSRTVLEQRVTGVAPMMKSPDSRTLLQVQHQNGRGSCFRIGKLILTAAHVLGKPGEDWFGEEREAVIWPVCEPSHAHKITFFKPARDQDLAVGLYQSCDIAGCSQNSFVSLNVGTVREGDHILLLGHWEGHVRANSGILTGPEQDPQYWQHTATSAAGFSGSPVLNKDGAVVGIHLGAYGDEVRYCLAIRTLNSMAC